MGVHTPPSRAVSRRASNSVFHRVASSDVAPLKVNDLVFVLIVNHVFETSIPITVFSH